MKKRTRFIVLGIFIVAISLNSFSQVQKPDTVNVAIRYLVYTPLGYNLSDTVQWPLVVFLHGSGERGTDIEKVKVHGPPKMVEQGQQFEFILISPQCEPNERWKPGLIAELIEEVASYYRVDRTRIYLTGLSMGGTGTWETAMRYPELFAAIAPICGGGDPAMIQSLAKIPVWNFHGAKDPVVSLSRSDEMVEALRIIGGDVKYTIYPDATHDSWTETYNNPDLFRWMLSKSKARVRRIRD